MYQLALVQTPVSVFPVPLGSIKFKSTVPVTSICGEAGKEGEYGMLCILHTHVLQIKVLS